MKLADRQEWMAEHLTHYRAMVNPPAKLKQLTIYQNNSLSSRISSIALTFGYTRKNLGEDYSRSLFRSYAKQTPSSIADLNLAGEDFIAYIAQAQASQKELADYPYLQDLAQADWLLNLSYYMEQPSHFKQEDFAEIKPEEQTNVVFLLAPNAYLQCSKYPIKAIMDLCDDSTPHSPNNASNISRGIVLNEYDANHYFLAHHLLGQQNYYSLNKQAYSLLQAICEQTSFGELMQASLTSEDANDTDQSNDRGSDRTIIGELLGELIQLGVIDGFYLKNADQV